MEPTKSEFVNAQLYLLFQLEEQSKYISQKQDVAALKKQIYDLSMVRITFSFLVMYFLLDYCLNKIMLRLVFQEYKNPKRIKLILQLESLWKYF